MMPKIAAPAVLSAMTMLNASSARADEFCDAVKIVVAAAPSDFETIRGKPDKHDPLIYTHPFRIPGARWIVEDSPGCGVFRSSDSPPTFTYQCTFFGGGSTRPEAHAALVNFASRVATCLGVAAPDIDRSVRSEPDPVASIAFRPFRLAYAPAEVTVRLDFLPDGGEGILSLRVSKPK